jgi:hypothetical protein
MVRYVVVDTQGASRLLALRDDAGRYHVAYCKGVLPEIESVFFGDLPELGIALFMDPSGNACRVVFAQIDCAQSEVFDQLHKVSSTITQRRPANDLRA